MRKDVAKKYRAIYLFVFYVLFSSILLGEELSKESLREIIDSNSGNWKSELGGLLMEAKEQIEAVDDEQMYKSSIAISHFDNALEQINRSKEYSEEVEKSILSAIKAKNDFVSGVCPDLVVGINKIKLKRFGNAPLSEFVIRVPESYDRSKKWPILVYADPRRVGTSANYQNSSNIITLWWHFPMPLGYEWKDYELLLDVIRNKINFDEDRIYVNGECGNGIASVDLALKYPDQWAECSASLGNASRYLAGNAYNLPVIFVRGGHKEEHLVGYFDFAVKCFEYHNCRFLKHSKPLSTFQIRGSDVPSEVRIEQPLRVLYSTEGLDRGKAYWVSIDGREDENYVGGIDAIVWGQKIFVKTNNVNAYTLDFCGAPVDANRPVEIIENDKSLGKVTYTEFVRRAEKYKNAKYIKNERICGPVKDVFSEPFVFVISSTDSNETDLCRKTAESMFKNATILYDVNVTDEIISNNNLVIMGTRKNNIFLKRIADELPVKIRENIITAYNIKLEGVGGGAIFVHPNPLNKEKHIGVFTANTEKGLGAMGKAYATIKNDKWVDVAVFEVDENNTVNFYIKEKFNSIWGFHENRSEVLMSLNEKQPRWKWLQYFARAIRKELGADVAIFENVICNDELFRAGDITFRDICNSIDNRWIVKVAMPGKQIRNVLSVPFNNITERKVDAPVIDGISFFESGEDELNINELKDEKIYTVAMPYKVINGKRMGAVMEDYRIEGDGWLELLVRKYITKEGSSASEELKKIKPRIF